MDLLFLDMLIILYSKRVWRIISKKPIFIYNKFYKSKLKDENNIILNCKIFENKFFILFLMKIKKNFK